MSLTSVPGKLLESVIKDKIVEHLEINNLIKNSQHGFMARKSTTTNLLEFLETVTNEYDSGVPVDLLYLDFAKAFDKVPRRRLIEKMQAHSINGKLVQWINNWLSNRKQRVVINGNCSNWAPVYSGVPQGSILGPLAFIIFINDLEDGLDDVTIIRKFADDTKLGQRLSNETDRKILQDGINTLVQWATDWGMEFNVGKCKIVHTGKNNPKHQYFMAGQPLTVSDLEKDVGFTLHASLRPHKMTEVAARTGKSVLRQLMQTFKFRDKKVFIQLYKQYVRPHLEFATPVWSPWTQGDIDLLESVQEKAVKQVVGLKSRGYLERLKELGLTTLQDRRWRFDLIQTYKIIHGLDKVDCGTWFSLFGDITNLHMTRLRQDPLNIIPGNICHTDIRTNFFSKRVISPWNNLPTEVKHSRNINIFKHKLDRIIHTKYQ